MNERKKHRKDECLKIGSRANFWCALKFSSTCQYMFERTIYIGNTQCPCFRFLLYTPKLLMHSFCVAWSRAYAYTRLTDFFFFFVQKNWPHSFRVLPILWQIPLFRFCLLHLACGDILPLVNLLLLLLLFCYRILIVFLCSWCSSWRIHAVVYVYCFAFQMKCKVL